MSASKAGESSWGSCNQKAVLCCLEVFRVSNDLENLPSRTSTCVPCPAGPAGKSWPENTCQINIVVSGMPLGEDGKYSGGPATQLFHNRDFISKPGSVRGGGMKTVAMDKQCQADVQRTKDTTTSLRTAASSPSSSPRTRAPTRLY